MTSIPNEDQLIRDRWLVVAALASAVALCWSWIAPMALDMYGTMTGSSAWMMTRTWDFSHQALLFAMWAVMMIGMMLPSAAPALFRYASVLRRSAGSENVLTHAFAFAVGYLGVWLVFSLMATALQLGLAKASLLSPMIELRSHLLSGGLVLIAGCYQFTPWKRRCLRCCQSQVIYGGGFRNGLRNGLSCLGCCWALMLILFVGGVMRLWWISVLTIFVVLEKVTFRWNPGTRLSGGLLLVAGAWILLVQPTPPNYAAHQLRGCRDVSPHSAASGDLFPAGQPDNESSPHLREFPAGVVF